MTGNFDCHGRYCYKKKLSLMAIFGKYFLYPCFTSGVWLPSLEEKKESI